MMSLVVPIAKVTGGGSDGGRTMALDVAGDVVVDRRSERPRWRSVVQKKKINSPNEMNGG